MADYDIGAAFEAIENELIESMIRNMKRHRVEEIEEGFEWDQWQALQLEALAEYRKKNEKKFSEQFKQINKRLEEAIREARKNGSTQAEADILEAIKKGFAGFKKQPEGVSNAFFKTNERKLNALIKATKKDMAKAEHAILRMANDQYRKVVFNAQVYANTGAGTYEKAVDMATRNMLQAGLNCVEYKNGARHTLRDYADMVIRTANTRAYLAGEAEMREEWGIHTVIVNKRTAACPKCMPFVGKVLIDDVYGNGTKKDGKYTLLSSAVSKGFLHPRCKDVYTTYFPELEEDEETALSPKEKKALVEKDMQAEKQKHAERQAEKYQRMADGSLDSENRQTARHRANQWKEQAAPFKPAETIEEAQEYAQQFCKKNFMDRTFKGEISFKGISVEHANAINRSLTDVFTRFPELEKLSGIKVVDPASRLGIKAFPSGEDALFSYDPIQHGIYINKAVLKNPKTLDAYMQRSQEAWDLVMNNMDKLSGRQKELAERYAKAGRDLVSGDTVEGLFTHELGHHVQWTMLDPKTTNSITSRMQEYAPHLSGYATASKSEYLAESFAAYMKGETDLLDPEYVSFINNRIKIKQTVLSGSPLEVNKKIVFTDTRGDAIITSSKQFGKKAGKHAAEFGLNVETEAGRESFAEITQDIIKNATEIRTGEWRSQPGMCDFYIKDNDVVIVNNGEYVTTLKGGIDNERIKNARRKEI